MGKKSKGLRHIKKMLERRKQKALRAAAYAAMAERGNNSKKKNASVSRSLVKNRDLGCKNIGDIIAYPDLVSRSLARFDRDSYTGRYKHQLAYERMVLVSDTNSIQNWLDKPIKDHRNQTTTRREYIKVLH